MIGAAIVGFLAGVIGRVLMPGDPFHGMSGPKSWGVSVLIGLAGAALGYLIFTVGLGIGDTDVFDFGGIARVSSRALAAARVQATSPCRRATRGRAETPAARITPARRRRLQSVGRLSGRTVEVAARSNRRDHSAL